MKIKPFFLAALFAFTTFLVSAQEPTEVTFAVGEDVTLTGEQLGTLSYEIIDSATIRIILRNGTSVTLNGDFSDGKDFAGVVTDVKTLADAGKEIIEDAKSQNPEGALGWLIAIGIALSKFLLAGGATMVAPIVARTSKFLKGIFSNIKDNRNLVILFSLVAGAVWSFADGRWDEFGSRAFVSFAGATVLYSWVFPSLDTPQAEPQPAPQP